VYLGVASLAIAFLLQVKAADQVKYAKRKMERASLIVGTPSCQLLQMVQQFVKKGDPVAKIYEVRTIKAQIMISEKEVSEVKVGQPIELKARLSD
jgi:predicted MarR family transcription regulator